MSLHQQQHKETREARVQNKMLSDLKKENLQLKRKISRLNKQIQKLLEAGSQDEAPPAEERQDPAPEPGPGDLRCPKCHDRTTKLVLPFAVLNCCRSCGWRARV